MMRPELQAGDIVFFSAQHKPGLGGWLSRSIAWMTARKNAEPPTMATHCGMMRDPVNICEALSRVTIQPLSDRLEGNHIEIYRPFILIADTAATSALRGCLTHKCDKWEGRKYGYLKIAAQALDGLLGEVYLFRRLCRINRFPICSWLDAYGYAKCLAKIIKALPRLADKPDWTVKPFFGVEPNAATPDDLHDACQNPARFVKLWTHDPHLEGATE